MLSATLPARQPSENVPSPSFFVFRTFLPWAIAAGFALGTVWFAQLYVASRSEAELLRSQAALTEISLRSSQQQLEAERIIIRQQLATLEKQAATASAELADRERQLAALTNDLKSQVDLSSQRLRRHP